MIIKRLSGQFYNVSTPISRSENHKTLKYVWNVHCLVTDHLEDCYLATVIITDSSKVNSLAQKS